MLPDDRAYDWCHVSEIEPLPATVNTVGDIVSAKGIDRRQASVCRCLNARRKIYQKFAILRPEGLQGG